ncbi:hypothetical protein HZA86_03635 [Candidatus Uhrbacteria bacterium]|nr:hypothetical protein [Candidatus Uhrbacteria bacterium]
MITWSFRNSGLSVDEYKRYRSRVAGYVDRLKKAARQKDYTVHETSIALPGDRRIIRDVDRLVDRLRAPAPLLVVVGIGGSNLGAQAVYEALRGPSAVVMGASNVGELLFADTVDRFKFSHIENEIAIARRQKRRVILNIISKSGSTTETIMNAELLVKKAGPFQPEDVVVTTDEHSPLWELAKKSEYHVLAIPKIVGGRYSVFTAVGLFPLAIAHLDVAAMLSGARWAVRQCLGSLHSSPAVKSASVLYHHATHGRAINDNFFFRTDLESLGKWYRQLMGESIGKEGNGMMPTVSIGSTDLHSMGQLYLGGPQDKVTTFIAVWGQDDNMRLPKKTALGSLVGGVIDGRSTDEVLQAILKGTQAAYARKKHPFMQATFSELNEFNFGAFMQWKMIEMMFLGKLLGVNAFDQPNVEEYKTVTRRLLANY